MRKIEQEMISRIVPEVGNVALNWAKSNTKVEQTDTGQMVFLHGHLIARVNQSTKTVTLWSRGWLTLTTKNRINAVLHKVGVGAVWQKNRTWYVSTNDGVEEFYEGIVIDFSTHKED